jgi:hypothetical protein
MPEEIDFSDGVRGPARKTHMLALLDELDEKTCILSYHIHDHPLLLKIVAMGQSVVPHLLDYLKGDCEKPAIWYAIIALGQITKANPIKKGHEGRLQAIIDDWLEWERDPKIEGGAALYYWPTGKTE